MKTEEQRLEKEIKKLLEKANSLDLKEDQQYGRDRRGDEIPEELAHQETDALMLLHQMLRACSHRILPPTWMRIWHQ
ncbi:MAG: hypothetical protein A4E53_01387 [Pelotomaculum sp. PtaB.Bin104]|nr:MAG: hypothetical protein A4E53_01387 [Pelotomaculum sp. PtaB.Bin104]